MENLTSHYNVAFTTFISTEEAMRLDKTDRGKYVIEEDFRSAISIEAEMSANYLLGRETKRAGEIDLFN